MMLLAKVDFYESTIWIVGALFLCCVVAFVLYWAWQFWLERNEPIVRAWVEVDEYEDIEPDIRSIKDLSVEQLLDAALDARAQSQRIERAMWRQFGETEPQADTELAKKIKSAVYECKGWSALLIEHYRYEKALKERGSESSVKSAV